MLKLLHTADWHLGQQFHGFDRDEEHRRFLDWLARTLHEQSVDVLLIAGDVFDAINPPIQAQRRLFDFFRNATLHCPKLQIVIIAGNHDSGSRLEIPSPLLESFRITVVGTVPREDHGSIDLRRFLVPLRDQSGVVKAIAVAVPYLRPSDVPFVADANDPYLDGIRAMYRQVTDAAIALRDAKFPGAVLIAMGHCHLHGGTESKESERPLVIGGAEAITPDAFPSELSYVALGHLHRPQRHDDGRVVYSGSPIPLSFSERTTRHEVVLLQLDDAGRFASTAASVPQAVALLEVPDGAAQPLEDVLRLLEAADFKFSDRSDPSDRPDPADETRWPFLKVKVLNTGPEPDRRVRVEKALTDKPVRLGPVVVETSANAAASNLVGVKSMADLQSLDAERMLFDVHRSKHGNDPDAELLTVFRDVLLAEAMQG